MAILPAGIFGNKPAGLIESVLGEIFVLLVFFVTWIISSRLWASRNKEPTSNKWDPPASNKSKWRKDPAEAAQLIQDLCKDHFTRALRLYRELTKHDLDKGMTNEEFHLALVEGAVRVGKPDVAMQVIERMRDNGLAPTCSFLQSVFRLLCARKYYQEVMLIAEMVPLQVDPVITSCLTLAAGEIGQLDLCEDILSRGWKAEEKGKRGQESKEYLPLMRAYARRKDWVSAVRAVRELMEHGAAVENVLFNSVLASCGHDGNPDEMYALLTEMRKYDSKSVDIVSYNTLMKGFARKRRVKKCFDVLEEIQTENLQPDDVTFSTLLDVCIDEDEHQLANVALDKLTASGVQMNCVLLTTLMKGFIRSKRLDLAMNLYDSMRGRDSAAQPDTVTYSQLIKAHCDSQSMDRALDILEDMLQCGCRVDDVVFTHLIDGCCHINNWELAEKLFKDMRQAAIRPTIYAITALIKVYGKCGQSQKAKDLVDSMEDIYGVKPTVIVYTCLISGLLRQRKHRAAYAAFQRVERTPGLSPDTQCVTTVLFGLADAQMWDELCSVAQRCPIEKKAPRYNEALNTALNSLLVRGEIAKARALHKLMTERKIEITVSHVQRRMNRT
jgi:leucine-rich PPR motif-containing protein